MTAQVVNGRSPGSMLLAQIATIVLERAATGDRIPFIAVMLTQSLVAAVMLQTGRPVYETAVPAFSPDQLPYRPCPVCKRGLVPAAPDTDAFKCRRNFGERSPHYWPAIALFGKGYQRKKPAPLLAQRRW